MKLTTEDTQLFYKLNWSLLFYANQKFNIIPGLTEPNFKKENVDKVVKIHQKIYQDLSLIDLFIKDNPFKLSPENLIIVESWKKKINSKFLLMKHSEEGTIFFDQSKRASGVAVADQTDEARDLHPCDFRRLNDGHRAIDLDEGPVDVDFLEVGHGLTPPPLGRNRGSSTPALLSDTSSRRHGRCRPAPQDASAAPVPRPAWGDAPQAPTT